MEQELERIFRLMALLLPQAGLHDAYVGVRSSNPTVRANALEFLDNVLKPELRQVLVPLLDSQVTVDERIEIANRLVGAPLETPDQAVATLLASDDPWLRSCAIQAVGTLRLAGLAPELKRYEDGPDPLVREAVVAARARLAGDSRRLLEPQHPRRRIWISASAPADAYSAPYSSSGSSAGAAAFARPHQPLDPQRHRRRHAVRTVGQIALEILVSR